MNISLTPPRCKLEDLVLPMEILAEVRALLEEIDFEEAFREHRIPIRKKVLLHGPSGCGKTSIAHALAYELEMKVGIVPLADTVGSTLGSSEKAVTSAIQFATQNRCVLLLDEFDSIAAERDDSSHSASKSLNRVVNTLLVDLESKAPLGMIVACTNLRSAIDPAMIRRFDLVLEIPNPSREALKQLADGILRGRFGLRAEDVLALAVTPAQVVQKAFDLLRRKVVEIEKAKRADTLPLWVEPAEAARHIRKSLEKQAPAKAEAT